MVHLASMWFELIWDIHSSLWSSQFQELLIFNFPWSSQFQQLPVNFPWLSWFHALVIEDQSVRIKNHKSPAGRSQLMRKCLGKDGIQQAIQASARLNLPPISQKIPRTHNSWITPGLSVDDHCWWYSETPFFIIFGLISKGHHDGNSLKCRAKAC